MGFTKKINQLSRKSEFLTRGSYFARVCEGRAVQDRPYIFLPLFPMFVVRGSWLGFENGKNCEDL